MELNEVERRILRTIKIWQRRYMNSPTVQELSHVWRMEEREVMMRLNGLQDKGYVDMVHSVSDRLMIVPLYWE